MADVFLEKGKGLRVELGHPWVYKNEIKKIKGQFEDGDIVDVYNFKKKFIGKGFINTKSQITVRIISRNKNEIIDKNFFRERVKTAIDLRKSLGLKTNCRLIFAEADFLPGLIVDSFNDVLVMQVLSLGMEKVKGHIINALIEEVSPTAIYERNDVKVRELEGLSQNVGFVYGNSPTKLIIKENDVNIIVDIENGQKTGYFFDQRDNRLALKNYVYEAYVLDCFCHTGSFALNAAKFGAKKVIGVDISEIAINQSIENAKLNNLDDKCEFIEANVFDYLKELDEKKEKFDVIILDPPAFAKNMAAIEGAKRGYKEINLRAMKLLKKGGFLVTCSCSHYMKPDLFMDVIKSAAFDCKKNLKLIEYRYQAKDHPYLIGYDESLYLKCYIFQVL
ncbi:class I SAM-dependent rRNA methyltransferase [Caldicellulosiruptoraceae bacterium PP1]